MPPPDELMLVPPQPRASPSPETITAPASHRPSHSRSPQQSRSLTCFTPDLQALGSSPKAFLHVKQIRCQRQPEQHSQNRDQIHDESRRFKLPLIQLRSRLPIAGEPGHYHHHAGDNGDHSHPDREPRRLGGLPLKSRQLPQGDSEPSNRKSEHDNRHTRPHPRQKRALVG